MLPAVFQINNRFLVDSRKNQVLDQQSQETRRIEPRLMEVLCLLAGKNDELVTRELIIKEIWADYPGAGEGLNQAISILRKLLDDEGKQMIRTVPKSGYIFSAVLGNEAFAGKPQKEGKSGIPKGKLVLAFAMSLVLFLSGYYLNKRLNPKTDKELEMQRAMEASRGDSAHQAEMEKRYKKQ